ncbi:type II secretion system minor pseudopilin GspJ [Candidatus Endoriftia persephone]|uniref:Type II secretion system protein J n=3 Tax=Gammaproteobacteria TaxID=1236 RepID=G2FHI5_9GAMM|nr:type II secretion system minor pseudopilin GspJ [Candidatus Endoriftia persephone]EGV51897.1 general secretion pathway protein J [endosymbiont of Riftia pachyptila (vent Ph05)]EGW53745.1 general secretion pathway protein J [endosymbiont of Tevnia jerichonana (vent Tica)]USF86443.1 type II secretion system minor pseudopilin GspJ [Candidatus Endoriftia persephone]
MPPRPQTTAVRGFTLLELLIAIAVFSFVSIIAYGGIKSVLNIEESTRAHLDRLSKAQLALALIRQDLEQVVARSIRDQHGDTQPPLRSSSLGENNLVEFTRGGFANPLKLPRSSLQRIAYQLEDEKLYRLRWLTLDRSQEDKPVRTELLSGVKKIELRFLDHQLKLHTEWPDTGNLPRTEPVPELPRAIELKLELEAWGPIRRLFRISEQLPAKQPAAEGR